MRLLSLLIGLLLTGCASVSVYSIMPEDNECVNSMLRKANYCTSENIKETSACYRRIKNYCTDEWVQQLLREGKKGGQ